VRPEGRVLSYTTTDRKRDQHYRVQRQRCECCAAKDNCLAPKQQVKTIRRRIGEDAKNGCSHFTNAEEGREI
jgi:hypothetical protein